MEKRGISRRSLFGLGLSRLGERVDAKGFPPPLDREVTRRPSKTADVKRRWAAVRTDAEPLWAPVADAVVAKAAPLDGAYVLLDGVPAPHGTAGVGRMPSDGAVMPLGSGTFDAALSCFGLQCALDGRGVLRELIRGVRPDGVVSLSVWTDGAIPALLRAAADLDPLPEAMPGAWEWGDRDRLVAELGERASEVDAEEGEIEIEVESIAALLSAVPAVGAALSGGGAARERLADVLGRHAEPSDAEGERLRVKVPYLVLAARLG